MAHQWDEQTKATVMAALLTGQSVSSVAKEYSVPKGTVSRWKQLAHEMVERGPQERTQKRSLDELLLEYMEENLTTLRAHARTFRDEKWIKRHSPSEAAVLHGVLADKTVRLLEAFGGSGARADSDEGAAGELG